MKEKGHYLSKFLIQCTNSLVSHVDMVQYPLFSMLSNLSFEYRFLASQTNKITFRSQQSTIGTQMLLFFCCFLFWEGRGGEGADGLNKQFPDGPLPQTSGWIYDTLFLCKICVGLWLFGTLGWGGR